MNATMVVCTDAGHGIGHGHALRQLALTQAWVAHGGRTVLVARRLPESVVARWEAEPAVTIIRIDEVSVGALLDVCRSEAPSWVALDGYDVIGQYQDAVADAGYRSLVVDDHATTGRYRAGVIVDQNLDARPEAYKKSGDAVLLMGSSYALLRREFDAWTDWVRPPTTDVARVLITLGGGRAGDRFHDTVTAGVRESVGGADIVDLGSRAPVSDMAALMASCDLALSAAGSTAWELCRLGVPAVLLQVADNQAPVAAALARRGAAIDLGPADRCRVEDVARATRSLVRNSVTRSEMAEAGQRLIDGRGSKRVVAALRAQDLRVRPADAGDARRLWDWVNDPDVRRAAFSDAPIAWEDHCRWLGVRIADPASRLYIVEDGETGPVGQIRFDFLEPDDREPRRATVDVSVDRAHRGSRLGGAVIRAGCAQLERDLLRDDRRLGRVEIHAEIKEVNRASDRAFDLAGFARRTEEHRDGAVALRRVLELEACREASRAE